MILDGDLKCPYCGKENNVEKLEEYLLEVYEERAEDEEIDEMDNVALTCEHCKKDFEINVWVDFLPDFQLCKIYK